MSSRTDDTGGRVSPGRVAWVSTSLEGRPAGSPAHLPVPTVNPEDQVPEGRAMCRDRRGGSVTAARGPGLNAGGGGGVWTDQTTRGGWGSAADALWGRQLLDFPIVGGGHERPSGRVTGPSYGVATAWRRLTSHVGLDPPRKCVSHKNEGHWAIFMWTGLEEFSNS